jgi:hypothetical protein
LVDRVASSAGDRSPDSAAVVAGQGVPVADCLDLLEALTQALCRRDGEPFLPGGVKAAGTADDLVLGTAGPGRRLAPGADWRPIASWASLAKAVTSAGPGATGLVLWLRRTGPGHAFGVHNVAGKGPRWIELQAPPGHRVTGISPGYPAAGARAVVVDRTGRVIEEALPPVAESRVPALALTDPPASRTPGAIGAEIELARIRIRLRVDVTAIPHDEAPQRGDTLFSNHYLKGVVEQIKSNGAMFLELVSTTPVAEVPGDEGFADRGGFINTLLHVFNLFNNYKTIPISTLTDYFEIDKKAAHAVLHAPRDDALEELGVQFTLGVPISGKYDLYRWLLENKQWNSPAKKLDVETALAFAEEAGHWFAIQRSAKLNGDIPLVTTAFFHAEEFYALMGFAASTFAHAMAPLRMQHARNSKAEGYRPSIGTKQFISVASRHPAPAVRAKLPESARKFLDDYAPHLRGLFAVYAARSGPITADSFNVPIADPDAELDTAANRTATVRDYFDDAFLGDTVAPRVRPEDFNIVTTFDELDNGWEVVREEAMTVDEVRDVGPLNSVREFIDVYEGMGSGYRAVFARARRRKTDALRRLGDRARVIDWLGQIPLVGDVEALFQGTIVINSLPRSPGNGVRVDLNRDPFLDAIDVLASHPHEARSAQMADLASELRRNLDRLEAVGSVILGRLAAPGSPDSADFSGALVPWAATMGAARRLLAAADPGARNPIPEEISLTDWSRVSAIRGPFGWRSAELQRIDASVEELLAAREDRGRLARVLAAIHSWRLPRTGPNVHAKVVRSLEQRVVYELGALRERPKSASIAGLPLVPDDRQFFGSLTDEVNAMLRSGGLATAGVNRATVRTAGTREVSGIYWSLAPGNRSRASTRELAYEITLQVRAGRPAETGALRLRGGASGLQDTLRSLTADRGPRDRPAPDRLEPANFGPKPAQPKPAETGKAIGSRHAAASANLGGALAGPVTSPGHWSESELGELVNRVVGSARGGSADGAGAAADQGLALADCLILLQELTRALYPRGGEPFLPGGVRAAETADDLVLGMAGAGQRLAPGAGWRPIASWASLAQAVASAGPGATGLVLRPRRTGLGHAFAVHNLGDEGVRWIELQGLPGGRVTVGGPGYTSAGAMAVVVDGTGRVIAGALPSGPETAIPARVLALTDPPSSRGYGAIGGEFEDANMLVEASNAVVLARTDVLYENEYLAATVEQVSPDLPRILETVTVPMAEVEGDDGYPDSKTVFDSIDVARDATRRPGKYKVSDIRHLGFKTTPKGRDALLVRQGGQPFIAVQWTLGLELDGRYDFYRWVALQERLSGPQEASVDTATGLIFGDEAALRYAELADSEFTRGIPVIAAELYRPEEVNAVRGHFAATAAHAFAAIRTAHAEKFGHEEYRSYIGAKQFLAVASRHPAHVTRRALPDAVRNYLNDNAGQWKKRFTEYVFKFGPGSVADPFIVPIGERRVTVGDYFNDAFLERADETRVVPLDFDIAGSFDELDTGKVATRKRPLTLEEWRNAPIAKSGERPRTQYQSVSGAYRAIFRNAANRRARARALRDLSDPKNTIARLVMEPAVRDIETLFRNIVELNFLPRGPAYGCRVDIYRDVFLEAITQMAFRPGKAIPPEAAKELATELRQVLRQFDRLGAHAVRGFAADMGSVEFARGLEQLAATVRTARRLLLVADPGAQEGKAPEEKSLTHWAKSSEIQGVLGRRARSVALRDIDVSVRELLAAREDPRRLARVLANIHFWRRTKLDADTSKRTTVVAALEQRVIYELGAFWGRPQAASSALAPQSVDDQQFFDSLTDEVNVMLRSESLAMAGDNPTGVRAAGTREVSGIYWNLAPADRSRATTRELAYEIALQVRAGWREEPQALRLRGGASGLQDTLRSLTADRGSRVEGRRERARVGDRRTADAPGLAAEVRPGERPDGQETDKGKAVQHPGGDRLRDREIGAAAEAWRSASENYLLVAADAAAETGSLLAADAVAETGTRPDARLTAEHRLEHAGLLLDEAEEALFELAIRMQRFEGPPADDDDEDEDEDEHEPEDALWLRTDGVHGEAVPDQQLLGLAVGLLGTAPSFISGDEDAVRAHEQRHESIMHVMSLLREGRDAEARKFAARKSAEQGFNRRVLPGGVRPPWGLVVGGSSYTRELEETPLPERAEKLAHMVAGLRQAIRDGSAGGAGLRQVAVSTSESSSWVDDGKRPHPLPLSDDELRRLDALWEKTERKLRRQIVGPKGKQVNEPLIPGGPVGKHPIFGAKTEIADHYDATNLGRFLLGWAEAKPNRRIEKSLARRIEADPVVNLVLDSVLLRIGAHLHDTLKNDLSPEDWQQIHLELTTGKLHDGRSWTRYLTYFNSKLDEFQNRGTPAESSVSVWESSDGPVALLDSPYGYSFREKIMAVHDFAEYMFKTFRGSLTPAQRAFTLEADEQGMRIRQPTHTPGERPDGWVQFGGKWYRTRHSLDESSPWTLLARQRRIPVWNGPSETVARILLYAGHVGAGNLEKAGVARAMGAFWRLHYDHTATASHTFHEVLDVAQNFGVQYSLDAPYAGLDALALTDLEADFMKSVESLVTALSGGTATNRQQAEEILREADHFTGELEAMIAHHGNDAAGSTKTLQRAVRLIQSMREAAHPDAAQAAQHAPAPAPASRGVNASAFASASKDLTLAQPDAWEHLRKGTPTAQARTERFEPSKAGASGNGLLDGWMTRISYEFRRMEISQRNWVREFTVRLNLKAGPSVSERDVEAARDRVTKTINEHINGKYRLPGGDQFHLRLEFGAFHPVTGVTVHDGPVHGKVTVHSGHATSQFDWSAAASGFVLAHEVLHYLGLKDEYKHGNAIFRAKIDDSAVRGLMGRNALAGPPDLRPDHLQLIEDIAASNVRQYAYPLSSPGGRVHQPVSEWHRPPPPDVTDLYHKIMQQHGVHLDPVNGATAVRESNPGAASNNLERIKPREFLAIELLGISDALKHYAPITGERRASSCRAHVEQEVQYLGAVSYGMKIERADHTIHAGYIATHKVVNLYGSAVFCLEFGGGQRAIEAILVHELAHGLLGYALDEFCEHVGSWTKGGTTPNRRTNSEPPSISGVDEAAADFTAAIKSYLLLKDGLARRAPRRAAFIAQLEQEYPEVFARQPRELSEKASQRIFKAVKQRQREFNERSGYWDADGFPAFQGERPITRYGATSPAEDMAESAMYYFLDPDKLRDMAPSRAAFFDKLVGGWNPDDHGAPTRTIAIAAAASAPPEAVLHIARVLNPDDMRQLRELKSTDKLPNAERDRLAGEINAAFRKKVGLADPPNPRSVRLTLDRLGNMELTQTVQVAATLLKRPIIVQSPGMPSIQICPR